MTPTIPTEDQEQAAFVQWFEYQFPKVRFFAIPNGGVRCWKTALRLKATGVKKGVPDLYFPKWKLWIEMKRQENGRLTKEQKEWLAYLEFECGDHTRVCTGFEDAKNTILAFRGITQ